MSETSEIYDAVCIAESTNGKSLLIEADDYSEEPQWIAKSVIAKDSEVSKVGDEGTLVIEKWLAKRIGWL